MASNKKIICAFEVMRNDGEALKKPAAYMLTTMCKSMTELVKYVKKTPNVTVANCNTFCTDFDIEHDMSVRGDTKEKAANAIAAALYEHPDFVEARDTVSKKKTVSRKPAVVVETSDEDEPKKVAPAPAKGKKAKPPVIVASSSDEEVEVPIPKATPAPAKSKKAKAPVVASSSDEDDEEEPSKETAAERDLVNIAIHDPKMYKTIVRLMQKKAAAEAASDSD